ncbi:Tetratricopeptide-like helical domain [Trinorchestia longiramus]|nr:Tetratricopeptide-like helical domain [Trinorchestia longiramus]
MAPDIKAALKEAKAGIKESDFEQVIKYCKIVLKHDRSNYQALVMFARACQEQSKFEDSKKALVLASTVEPDTPVAWQGLATLFDLQPQLSTPAESIKVYGKLIKLFDSGPKHIAFLRKLASAYESAGEAINAADTLSELLFLVKDEDKNSEKEIAQSIVNILCPIQDTLNEERLQQLLQTVKTLLSDSVLGNNETNYKLYLSLCHKTGDRAELLTAATKMAALFRTAYPLEWIARVFVQDHIPWMHHTSESQLSWSDCEASLFHLFELYPATLWGNLAVGLHYEESGELKNALLCYSRACDRSKSSFSNTAGQPVIWWRLYLEALQKAKDWPTIESTVTRILAILSETGAKWPDSGENVAVTNEKLKLLKAKALMQMGHEKHYALALSILKNLDSPASDLIIECLLYTDLAAARTELENLKSSLNSDTYDVLFAKLLFLECNFTNSQKILEQVLEKSANNVDALILLGRIHQKNRNDAASLSCLLKAAKLDSTREKAFLYLGHHYRRIGDKIKACKCYQKAYNLAPVGEEEGSALSDIYRELGEYDKNFALLNTATQEGASGGAWAWLRMGLHHLSIHDAQKAISALQRCLQLQHNHRQALESLGDAYLARGSYTAAQKVYERILTLDPEAVYPRCQIAKIYLCVGEPLIAVTQYEELMSMCNEPNLRLVTLLGLAQTHFVLASLHTATNHLDNTLSHCVVAIKILDEARELQPNSISIWKLLGDVCSLLYRLPHYLSGNKIEIPARLFRPGSKPGEVEKVSLMTVLQLASKCYGVAVKLSDADPTLWHDLGLSFYLTAKHTHCKGESPENVSSLVQRAQNCLKKSLSLSPLNSEAWNTFGLIVVHPSVKNMALAQHCFIKSVQLQPSASNWTHLGAFYLVGGEVQLAHQAFCQAQALDPRFVTCWTGQALVAESVQHYDAADLFRHCCTLGVQPESLLGHAHHVALALADNKTVAPSVLSLAADAMMFYSREFDGDSIGLNLAGLCLEKFGMGNTAAQLYSMALSAATQHNKGDKQVVNLTDSIRSNFGRVLTSLSRVQDAAVQLSSVSEPDFQSECNLALACLKGEDFETGYTKYMSALHWLAQNDHHKANILVALACLQYKFGKIQEAKTLLFESCQEGGGCVAGIIALGALGLIEGDATLITAALNELAPRRHTDEASHHVTFLTAAQAIIKGETNEAKNILSRAILCRPHCHELWRFLSWHLVCNAPKQPSSRVLRRDDALSTEKLSKAIVACASSASVLSQSSSYPSIKSRCLPTQDGTTRVWGFLRASDKTKALKEAQRSLLMHPGHSEAWVTMISAAVTAGVKDAKVQGMAKVWTPKCAPTVQEWLHRVVLSTPA